MRVFVNGEERSIDDGTTVSALLEGLGIMPVGIAVEVNMEVVPKRFHGETPVNDGDRIEIIRMVGGG